MKTKQKGFRRFAKKHSKEFIIDIIKKSRSYADTLKNLDLTFYGGGNYAGLKRFIEENDVDTSHFTGSVWNKGKKFGPNPKIPLEDILSNKHWMSSTKVKSRLFAIGLLVPICSSCNLSEWRDRPIPTHLDHINGNKYDNRLENLRILCPNCHAQTKTYCRGQGKYQK